MWYHKYLLVTNHQCRQRRSINTVELSAGVRYLENQLKNLSSKIINHRKLTLDIGMFLYKFAIPPESSCNNLSTKSRRRSSIKISEPPRAAQCIDEITAHQLHLQALREESNILITDLEFLQVVSL